MAEERDLLFRLLMRVWHTLVLAFSLAACGGIVSEPGGPSPASSASDSPAAGNDTPTSSGANPVTSGGTAPTPVPTSTATPTPSIFAGATGVQVKGATLGAPPGGSNARSYRFEPSPTKVTVSTEDAEQEIELTAAESQELRNLLAAVRPIAMPTVCAYDGPTSSLVVSLSGRQVTYIPEDYNCSHRTDVSYASGVQSVLAFLDSVRSSR